MKPHICLSRMKVCLIVLLAISAGSARAAEPLDPAKPLPTWLLPQNAAVDGDLSEWSNIPAIEGFKPANINEPTEGIYHDFAANVRFGMKRDGGDLYFLVVVKDSQRKSRLMPYWPEPWFAGDYLDFSFDFGMAFNFNTEEGKAAAGAPAAEFKCFGCLSPISLETRGEIHFPRELQSQPWKVDYVSVPVEGGVAYECCVRLQSTFNLLGTAEIPPDIGIDLGLMDQDYPIIFGIETSTWKNSCGYYRLFGRNRFFPTHGKLSTSPTAVSDDYEIHPLPRSLKGLYGEFPAGEDVAAAERATSEDKLADLVYWAGCQGALFDADLVQKLLQHSPLVQQNTLAVLLFTDQDSEVAAHAVRQIYGRHKEASPPVLVSANLLNERLRLGYREEVRDLLNHSNMTVSFTAARALAEVGTAEDLPYFQKLYTETLADLKARYKDKNSPEYGFIEAYHSYWGGPLDDLLGRTEKITIPQFTSVRSVLAENTDLHRVIPIDGNTTYNARGLYRSWPKDGPRELWRLKVGLGESGVTESNGRAFTIAQVEKERRAICINARTGEVVWQAPFPKAGADSYGPMPTPLIDNDRVYVVPGRDHPIVCLGASDGKELWRTTEGGVWFSTPMIIDNTLYASLAGPCPLAAFDKLTGKLLWKAPSSDRGLTASPASPVYQIIDGIPQVIFGVGTSEVSEVWGVRADSGELMWQYACTSTWGLTTTAVAVGSKVFVCDGSSSQPFSACLQMYVRDGKIRARQIYRSRMNQCNQVNTPAIVDGAVFGFSGNAIQCTNLADGKLLWQKQGEDWYANLQLIAADGLLFAATTHKELVLLEATRDGYHELGRVDPGFDFGCRQQHTLANGRLYLRGAHWIVCYRVMPEAE